MLDLHRVLANLESWAEQRNFIVDLLDHADRRAREASNLFARLIADLVIREGLDGIKALREFLFGPDDMLFEKTLDWTISLFRAAADSDPEADRFQEAAQHLSDLVYQLKETPISVPQVPSAPSTPVNAAVVPYNPGSLPPITTLPASGDPGPSSSRFTGLTRKAPDTPASGATPVKKKKKLVHKKPSSPRKSSSHSNTHPRISLLDKGKGKAKAV